MAQSRFYKPLQRLYRYSGVQGDDIFSRLSEELRQAWEIDSNDPEEVRAIVTERLEGMIIAEVPNEAFRLIARVSFNIAADYDENFSAVQDMRKVEDRYQWLHDLTVVLGTAKVRGFSVSRQRDHMEKSVLPALAAALDAQTQTQHVVVNETRTPTPQRRSLIISALTILAVALVGSVLILFAVNDGSQAPEGAPTSTPPTTNAASGPRIPGDNTEFYAGHGPKDGTTFPRNKPFVETWRIRNTGSVPWYDRYLVRQGPPQDSRDCRSKERAQVPDTMPGHVADITVRVTSPATPTRCKVYWKMADAQGRLYFPNKDPVFFDLIIE